VFIRCPRDSRLRTGAQLSTATTTVRTTVSAPNQTGESSPAGGSTGRTAAYQRPSTTDSASTRVSRFSQAKFPLRIR
jgi:hypothetical protein